MKKEYLNRKLSIQTNDSNGSIFICLDEVDPNGEKSSRVIANITLTKYNAILEDNSGKVVLVENIY